MSIKDIKWVIYLLALDKAIADTIWSNIFYYFTMKINIDLTTAKTILLLIFEMFNTYLRPLSFEYKDALETSVNA